MKSYLLTFAALLTLTGLTFGLSFASLGPWGVPAALAIASAKAVLIALFFMHLKEEDTPAYVATTVAVLLVVLLIVLATLDVTTRGRIQPTESAPPMESALSTESAPPMESGPSMESATPVEAAPPMETPPSTPVPERAAPASVPVVRGPSHPQ